MHSDLIGKIEKARVYAQQPERVDILDLTATFVGGNHTHLIELHNGVWSHDADAEHVHQQAPRDGLAAHPRPDAYPRSPSA
ncbi:MAG: hypothetical protein HC914_03810 [Chloroflexaceae bacterium]|nr:hypothetical protein [Chloroflexaceae bacterium]